jgi:hypothetical protein
MEKTTRRTFCGTALVALPLLSIRAGAGADDYFAESSDFILDSLADEFTRIAADGAEHGFKAEHFRRCAGLIRIYDGRLEEKGLNRDLDLRLDDDDFHKLNQRQAAKRTVEYWKKHGMYFDEEDFKRKLTMSPHEYQDIKKKIKKAGGFRKVHAAIAESLERKAAENTALDIKGTATFQKGRVVFPMSRKTDRADFTQAQWELVLPQVFGLPNLDCLCRAMVLEGALLALACLAGIAPCCIPSTFLIALEKLLEGMGLCIPSRC